jgi:hypothetical protein
MVKASTDSAVVRAFLAQTRYGMKTLMKTTTQWKRAQAIITSCAEITGEMKKCQQEAVHSSI